MVFVSTGSADPAERDSDPPGHAPRSNRSPGVALPIRSGPEPWWSLPFTGWSIAALVLVALRIPHLLGPLDDPQSWRQCDTAFYSLDFHRHGIDLLHPAVCWLGGHRTLILEFPLPEAIAALFYRAFGPDPVWDRVVSLVFFLASAFYLHAFVRRFARVRTTWLATLAYLAFPLSQFFSRAAQVDFAAVACAHGLLYHATVAIERRTIPDVAAAMSWGVLGALIKAPYLIAILGPLALVVLAARSVRAVVVSGVALGASAVAFVLWRRHVDAVNGAAPDWSFLPGYYKEVNALWWYVGSLEQRLDLANWVKLGRRFVLQIVSPLGALLALAALLWRGPRLAGRWGPLPVALAWLLASIAYLAVFFPLNVIHHYYQTPFLAPLAILVGLGADFVWQKAPRFGARRLPSGALAFGAFAIFATISMPSLGYYRVDWLRVEAGRLIERATPRGDLVVVADYASGHSDPRLLYRADRTGWPLAIADLDRERLIRLRELGARWAAVVTDPEHPELEPPAFLERGNAGTHPIRHAGRSIGTLRLYDLGRALD